MLHARAKEARGGLPSRRVVRAIPRILADLTPIIEPRGKRHWTLWIIRLIDPDMQAVLKKITPRSQLLSFAVNSEPRRPNSLQLGRALTESEEELLAERATNEDLRARINDLEAARGPRDGRSRALAELTRRITAKPAGKTNQDEVAALTRQVKSREEEVGSLREKCQNADQKNEALEEEKQALRRRLVEVQEVQDRQSGRLQEHANCEESLRQRNQRVEDDLSAKREELTRVSATRADAWREAYAQRQLRVNAERELAELRASMGPRASDDADP